MLRWQFWQRAFRVLALALIIVTLPLCARDAHSVASSSYAVYLPLVAKQTMPPIVFVSRQIMPQGSIYWDVPKGLAGVGPYSRFAVAAPGKLMVLEPDGRVRVLIDGANPASTAPYNLIDVNAPDVSYDGTTIVFAGLPQGRYESGALTNPGAWRIYTIKADGSGLRQVTTSNQRLDLTQFGPAAGGLAAYDDTDPVWLPDGRIVFSSTRWPAYAHYSGVRASNLFVVNPDGSNLRRITSERNGADRPLVDPITGKIVYARWWRNHRFPVNDMSTIPDPNGGYIQRDGLTANRNNPVGGETMFRNAWQAATINPDGTELAMWAGVFRSEDANHIYGGAFTPEGDLIANYFPMYNMTEAAGFGGLRRYRRGAGGYTPLMGVATFTLDYVNPRNPTSFGIFKGQYVTDPDVSNNWMVVSLARDIGQDYGLYQTQIDGSGLRLLYDNPGTAEVRARFLAPRPLPPIIPDRITQVPSLLPPTAAGPYDNDGTFIFDALNVYANGPVDMDIVNAPPVGSARTIRFFIDHQRTSPGSFPNLDWPILLSELAVQPDGSVRNSNVPANVPLFEQLRGPNGTVPLTGMRSNPDGAAHVAGMNFGRPGERQRCVGCHAGHTLIPVPPTDEAARWSNLAPGATIRVSSALDSRYVSGLTDRRVMKGEVWQYWRSAANQTSGQWVTLTFPVPVTVRQVRLYNPRSTPNTDLQVHQATVRLFSDEAGAIEVARQTVGPLTTFGAGAEFADVRVRVVRVEIDRVSGRVDGVTCASLAEIEVIARGEAGN
ncbi:hypothetical protein A6A03_07320 [Chloroflexus islandicus]|uniref:DUF7402 domain-containing protein n=1 Tax=Chloroflexus islandicus TaxID=1707952 RepID=A0A178MKB5_9CHLR|nr:PD40 domain-containing protein [Chloroflexus islandicus]OAN48577.1 hypothetical protein A6A03_07320 [Chloroflexus islandicus]